MVKDINNVDIIKPCDFVLYFDDEIQRIVLLELVFMMDLTVLLVRKSRRASLFSALRRDLVTWETVAPMVTS